MKCKDILFDLPNYTKSNKTDKLSIAKPRLKIPIRNQIEVMKGPAGYEGGGPPYNPIPSNRYG